MATASELAHPQQGQLGRRPDDREIADLAGGDERQVGGRDVRVQAGPAVGDVGFAVTSSKGKPGVAGIDHAVAFLDDGMSAWILAGTRRAGVNRLSPRHHLAAWQTAAGLRRDPGVMILAVPAERLGGGS